MKLSFGKTVYALVVLCGILYAFVALRGPNGIQSLIEKRKQVAEFEMQNDQMRRDITLQHERIQRLQTDPREQEIEIRQRLKLAAPGEKIYILDEKK